MVTDATLPAHFDALTAHKTIMAYEAAQSLALEYDSHHAQLSPQLRQLIDGGLAIDRAHYLEAQGVAASARAEFAQWMQGWDVLLAPSAPGPAPLGLYATGDPLFSRIWTLLGVPTITLPGASARNRLPIGMQLVVSIGEDEQLLAIARWAEPFIHDLSAHQP